jgi:Domain of Unknown Function (DUF928)
MKTSVATLMLAAAAAVALLASTAYAKDPESQKAPAAIAYKPPMRGAPATRVGGGTRGTGSALTLNVLAPGDTGYTVKEQPTIYWYVSERIDHPVELTLNSTASLQDAATPVLDITLKPPVEKGIHALRLADHGVALKPGVVYEWFVAVVRNPVQRSNDVVAGGTIKRVSESEALQAQLKQTSQTQWPAVYAQAGIWYDAIDQLSKRISAEAANRQLREERAALLEQVGLRDAAAYDRGAGG